MKSINFFEDVESFVSWCCPYKKCKKENKEYIETDLFYNQDELKCTFCKKCIKLKK